MKIFGLTGHPLGHSLSPLVHNLSFALLGLDAEYRLFQTPPDLLEDFFKQARRLPISGGNITIPHKVAAMALVDITTAQANKIGAINTFYWQNGLLHGENTDISGFIRPIRQKRFTHALVLGAGGAARAVLAGLQTLQVSKITICNRNADKARMLADEFETSWLDWEKRGETGADLIINATSLGMQGQNADKSPYPRELFRGSGLAYDIVYNPINTRFMLEAAQAGWHTQNGLDMFVGQAAEAFALWTGQTMPYAEAFEAVRNALLASS